MAEAGLPATTNAAQPVASQLSQALRCSFAFVTLEIGWGEVNHTLDGLTTMMLSRAPKIRAVFQEVTIDSRSST